MFHRRNAMEFVGGFFVILYYVYLSIRFRSLFFLRYSNTGIIAGGLYGNDKFSLLACFDPNFVAKNILIEKNISNIEVVLCSLGESELTFPLIAKPNMGCRGQKVVKINNELDLEEYMNRYHCDFILQEFVAYDHEFSMQVVRDFSTSKLIPVSLVYKMPSSIVGNGKKTCRELIYALPIYFRYKKLLCKHLSLPSHYVPSIGEAIRLHIDWNHDQGALYCDLTEQIDAQFVDVVASLCHDDRVGFGRFDVKASSLSSLLKGEEFSILEFNGSGAEPLQAYDTRYGFFSYIQIWCHHLHQMFLVSAIQKRSGQSVGPLWKEWQFLGSYLIGKFF